MQARFNIMAVLAFALTVPAYAVSTDAAQSENGLHAQTVRKTCECVRQHPSGFPYIEPRITECKTYKDAQGKVKTLDCMNCYAICADKPAG